MHRHTDAHLRQCSEEITRHRCDRRVIAASYQRGDLLVVKLYHGCRRRNRADAPLSSRRSAWM